MGSCWLTPERVRHLQQVCDGIVVAPGSMPQKLPRYYVEKVFGDSDSVYRRLLRKKNLLYQQEEQEKIEVDLQNAHKFGQEPLMQQYVKKYDSYVKSKLKKQYNYD